LHAFDNQVEEWEVRVVLGETDWDSAAATLELNKRIEEKKKKKKKKKKEQEASETEKAKKEEEKAREEAKNTVAERKGRKTQRVSGIFDKRVQKQAPAVQSPLAQKRQLDGAREQLVKNLQSMFNPNMLMGGPPPRMPRTAPPSAPGSAGKADELVAETAVATTPEDKQFVDNFLEVRKARVVGARGRRAPSRRPRGASHGEAPATTAGEE